MYIIGLCGRSGSGKSTVATLLRLRGAVQIDADEVCRYVYANDRGCIEELKANFGEDIYKHGGIDRPLLSKRAYEAENGFKLLNSVAHKYITYEIENRIKSLKGKRTVLLDAPLLFEAGLEKRCHAVLAVVSDDKLSVKRLMRREGKSEEELRRRLDMQISAKELTRRSDFVIFNNGSLSELKIKTYQAMLYIHLKLNAVKRTKGRRYYAKADC